MSDILRPTRVPDKPVLDASGQAEPTMSNIQLQGYEAVGQTIYPNGTLSGPDIPQQTQYSGCGQIVPKGPAFSGRGPYGQLDPRFSNMPGLQQGIEQSGVGPDGIPYGSYDGRAVGGQGQWPAEPQQIQGCKFFGPACPEAGPGEAPDGKAYYYNVNKPAAEKYEATEFAVKEELAKTKAALAWLEVRARQQELDQNEKFFQFVLERNRKMLEEDLRNGKHQRKMEAWRTAGNVATQLGLVGLQTAGTVLFFTKGYGYGGGYGGGYFGGYRRY